MCRAQEPVRQIEGSTENVKVTYPEDHAPLRMMSQSRGAHPARRASG
jgi:2-C-methyl-D-erythritol 4-phosphate cytidylyltransferase